jgi:hypothetical protein
MIWNVFGDFDIIWKSQTDTSSLFAQAKIHFCLSPWMRLALTWLLLAFSLLSVDTCSITCRYDRDIESRIWDILELLSSAALRHLFNPCDVMSRYLFCCWTRFSHRTHNCRN